MTKQNSLSAVVAAIFFLAQTAWAQDGDSGNTQPAPVSEGAAEQQGGEAAESAGQQEEGETVFTISEFVVDGPELVPRKEVIDILKGFEDRPITFQELRTATGALEKLHAVAGFEVVRVTIPEQSIEDGGKLKLVIVDARLNQVVVSGNSTMADTTIVNQLDSLQPDEPINTAEMDKDIRMFNSNPSHIARVTLEPSFEPRKVDAVVTMNEFDYAPVYLTLDNTGSGSTGDYRVGLIAMQNDLFSKGHQLTGQLLSSPGHWSDVKVFSVNYRLPVPEWNTLIDVSLSDSTVDAGTLGVGTGVLTVQGSGSQFSIKSQTFLSRLWTYDFRLLASFEDKKFDSEVILNGSGPSLVPDLASRPLGVGFSLLSSDPENQMSFKVMAHVNQDFGGNNSNAQYSVANPAARVDFSLIKGNWTYSMPVRSDWRFNAAIDFQLSEDSLISGEQFGVGGVYSVRGFEERSLGGDSGYRLSLEWVSGNWRSMINRYITSFNTVIFAESGRVFLNQPPQGLPSNPNIASVGVGFRAGLGNTQQLRMDVGRIVSGLPEQEEGSGKVHLSYVLSL